MRWAGEGERDRVPPRVLGRGFPRTTPWARPHPVSQARRGGGGGGRRRVRLCCSLVRGEGAGGFCKACSGQALRDPSHKIGLLLPRPSSNWLEQSCPLSKKPRLPGTRLSPRRRRRPTQPLFLFLGGGECSVLSRASWGSKNPLPTPPLLVANAVCLGKGGAQPGTSCSAGKDLEGGEAPSPASSALQPLFHLARKEAELNPLYCP